ncbi:SCO2583 family membrane protein [Streptomyces sp. 8N114]|uniref:SCO2583 family membrane protein n=1 Tax=Streptomyces sp. 8N114 TaxID=3457419 RepID=UPI003FCF8890
MGGRVDPPDGTPDGGPNGGDDEYRSLVFDESFIKAARLQEFSAQERLQDEEHAAVRARPEAERSGRTALGLSRQGLILVLLIALAFGTAIYMGIRNPYRSPTRTGAEPLHSEVLPLAPTEPVPGSTPADLFANSPAARFATGADGVALPPVRSSDHFSESQVLSALTVAKDYVVESSLDPDVLTGGAVRPVRVLLNPHQQRQFDQSVEQPRNDGRHGATAWMVRLDRGKAALASTKVRVDGTLTVQEVGDGLEVTADHVFVYAVRPADGGKSAGKNPGRGEKAGRGEDVHKGASLFSVRRQVRFRLEREDLRDHQVNVRQVAMRAGPMNCGEDPADALTPLLAGERAKDAGKAGTDPYARGRSTASMCGLLASNAQPSPDHPSRPSR